MQNDSQVSAGYFMKRGQTTHIKSFKNHITKIRKATKICTKTYLFPEHKQLLLQH